MRAAFCLLSFAAFVASGPLACSGSSASCDDSKCAAGNKCINTGTTTQCELVCAAQTDCPANYHCGASKDGAHNYCQADGVTFKAGPGQWGAHCDPSKGLDSNSDCDTNDQFWCYGRNPTDGQAFCTQFQCARDSDCALDYVCQTINTFPNVQTAARQFGQTTTVCLPRTYCEPCAADIDCIGPTGVAASCVAGTDGVKFCTTACQNDGNCNQDAQCDTNAGVCMPRAGVCKGDGTLCAPCYSDLDCPKGICAVQEYSAERYCTVKSDTPCTISNPACAAPASYCTNTGSNPDGSPIYGCTGSQSTTCDPKQNKGNSSCPTSTPSGARVSCTIDNSDKSIPQDNCFGVIEFGTGSNQQAIDGCWTKSQ